MTKGEVHALKGLAAKHGGQLTINPETGLVEAGFLSRILPTAAGIAVGIATENPMLGAAVAGIGSYAASGSVSQGLMAGISAYGGAGLGADLASTGLEAGSEEAVAAGNRMIEESANKMVTSNLSSVMPQGAQIGAETAGQITNMNQAADALKEGMLTPDQYRELASQYSQGAAPAMNAARTMGSGLKAITASPGAMGNFLGNNISNLAMTSAPLLADALSKRPTLPGASTSAQANPFGMNTIPTDSNGKPIFNATIPAQPNPPYVAKYANYVQNPYNPYSNTPTPTTTVHAADGGLMQTGPANVNFMGGDMYPQSQMHRSYYATPTQMPTSAQQVMASYEPKTNPLTGEATANMASGGIASYSGRYGSVVAANQAVQDLQNMYGASTTKDYLPKGDPGIYQDTDPNTRNLDAYSAALYKLNAKAKAAGMKKDAIADLKPVMKLGDIEEDAAGGVVGMAGGGFAQILGDNAARQAAAAIPTPSTVSAPTTAPTPAANNALYHAQYQDYQQNPMPEMSPEQLMAANAVYNPAAIPTPTRGIAPNTTGYAMDPTMMQGSPAYKAAQEKAAADAASKAASEMYTASDGSMWASKEAYDNAHKPSSAYGGGLMPQDLHYAIGGGIPSLGGYAAGGNPRLLKGPGDGMSDNIPATIGGRQPARLADGEFVVPADVVSHLGNGSTDAGAKKLYSMMDKIRSARTGRKKQAPAVKADKYLPR
jgi:hypothetical protein